MYFYHEIQYTLNYIIQYQVWNLGEPFMLKCKRSEEAVEPKGRSPATDSCQHHRDPRADFSEPSDTAYLLPKVPKCTYRYASDAKEILIARSPPFHCFYQCSQLPWVQLITRSSHHFQSGGQTPKFSPLKPGLHKNI